MKKELAFIFVFLVLSSVFVFAQDNPQDLAGQINQEARSLGQGIKNKTADTLNFEAVSPGLQKFAKIFFKVDRQVSFSEFVILSVVFLGFLGLMFWVFSFMPFLNKGFKKWAGAVIVSLLVAISGGIYYGSFYLFDIAKIISYFRKIGPVKTSFIIAGAAVVVFVIVFFLNKLKKKSELENSEMQGLQAGSVVSMLKSFKNMFK